jgi:hypothetical protein
LQIFSQSSSISRTSKTNLGIYLLNMGPMELRKHPTSRESTKARFATRNYHDRHPGSVTQMVQQLQWEPLLVRRVKIRLVLLYKIQHRLVAITAEIYLVPGDTRTRGEHKFCPPNLRKDVYKYSFFPRTIGDWNRLPPHVACATSLEGFKNHLDTPTEYQLGVQTL